ncbi:DNA polymerase III subunit gamma/tau [Pseudogulbenkiania sp. MAI-1]|uniref:DNA polymerase III subunit gamma/tau n=1 Tax=Pseudogulbenkiania sp. MAI-1 TaxID=990370 RepID=UPI00045EB39E|nr:DNA polymerase III subunit gamma/tau [Pseudogulbenkiania sp. MAI-1]
MTYQVLARKWRPKRFADLVGQEHVVRALTNALAGERLHHAYLLTGTRGVGKTTIARILAKSLNCETGTTAEPCGECSACRQIDAGRFVDLLEIDAASNTGIDNIREVLENAQYAPTAGRYKVYIIDEVHMLSKSAFNAMLKTLEEPPAHVKFILATTDPQKVPVTVLSRCLQFSLRNMTPQQVAGHLARVLDVEQVSYEAPALALLGRAAAGSMRDALSLLDQAIAYGVGKVEESGVRAMLGAVDRAYLYTLLEALAEADGPRLIAEAKALAERGIGFDSALGELALLLQQIALAQTVPEAIAADDPDGEAALALAQLIAPEDVQLYYQIAIHGRKDLALAPDEHAGFTMTLLRMLAFHPLNAPGDSSAPAPRPTVPSRPEPASRPAAPSEPSVEGASAAKALLARLAGRNGGARSVAASPDESAPADPEPEPARAEPPLQAPVVAAEPVAKPVPPVVAEMAAMPQEPAPWEDLPDDDGGDVAPETWNASEAGDVAGEPWPEPVAVPPAAAEPYVFDGDWPALVAELGSRMGASRMLAHNAVLKSWDGQRLQLAVPESFRHMATRDYQEKLKAVLAERFGRAPELSVSVEELGQETPAMREARFRQEQLAAARVNFENDPVVRQLVGEFNAVLLTETIQPVQEL